MATTIADAQRAQTTCRRRILTRLDGLLVGWRVLLAAAILYLGYALFVTWPLGTNLSGQLSAPNLLEDAAGTTSYFAYLVAHHMSPFLPGHMSGLNAPYGMKETWALNLAQAPSYLMMWLLALVFGAVAGANLFLLLGFVATGTTMFAITHRLFGSRIAALLAGFAFAFYPFAVASASVHYVFVHGWPLLLCVWRLIEMAHGPSRRNALLAGLATVLAMWWNPYYELFAGFAFASLAGVAVAVGIARHQTRRTLRAVGLAALPVAALGVFFLVLLKVAGGLSSVGTVARPLNQVYTYSAHLRDYLLPSPNNLLFGGLTGPYLNARLGLSNSWETAIYPGYVVMVLAAVSFARAVRALRADRAALGDIRVLAVVAAGVVATVAFLGSAPPSVSLGGLSVPLPSGILFRITPTWQTFSRFAILLELALCIMMAAELARLRRSLDARRVGVVMAIVGILLVVDLWARPAHRTVSTVPPAAYAWLRAHPGGTVADYPLLPAYAPANAPALFWQSFDGHPLLQGFSPFTTAESEKLDVADLGSPLTAGKLAAYGVHYIVVHGGTPGGDPGQLRRLGYRPIVRGHPGGDLWRVSAQPAPTAVDAESGFDWARGYPSYDRRLLLGRGALAVSARRCGDCTGAVSFSLSGVNRARRLTVRDRRTGAVLAQLAVPPRKASVRVTVPGVRLVDGHAQLTLQTEPRGSLVWIGIRSARLKLSRR